MDIGIAKEIAAKGLERRPILLPEEVSKLVHAGHQVFVESGLGEGIYIRDQEYRRAGAEIVAERKHIFNKSIVVKLKTPLPQEFRLLKNNLLFCLLHAEQNPQYIEALKKKNVVAIAMELIRNQAGERLIQCTEITGEQGMLMAFHLAEKTPAECDVLVLGYGAIASGALKVALSLGAKVKILRKREYPHIKHFIRDKDIIVNGIAWPKEKREKKEYLITKEMLPLLQKGAIIQDLSADYPNPIETCHPTYLDNPVYTVSGVRHVSLYGYPGLVPISSARQYSKQVLPLLLEIASSSLENLSAEIQKAVLPFSPQVIPNQLTERKTSAV